MKMIKLLVMLAMFPVLAMAGTDIGGGQIWPEWQHTNTDTVEVWKVLDLLTHSATVLGGIFSSIVSIDADSLNTDHLVVNTTAEFAMDAGFTLGAGTVGDQDIIVYADTGGTAFQWFRWDEGLDGSVLPALSFLPSGVHFADDDSLLVYSDKYNLYIRQATATAGSRSLGIVLVEEDGTEHKIEWNDAISVFAFDAGITSSANIGCTYTNNSTHWLVGGGISNTLLLDPNTSGAGTLNLGNNEADTTRVQSADFFDCEGVATFDSSVTIGNGAGDTLDLTNTIVVGLTTESTWESVAIPAGAAQPGGTAPAAVTIGYMRGLAFDADAELSYLSGCVCGDWDGASDLELKVVWCAESGDALADGETVIWEIDYYAISGDDGSEALDNGTPVTVSVTYTQSGAGTDKGQHVTTFTIDFDHTDQPIAVGDKIYFRFSRDMTGDSYAGDGVVTMWRFRQKTT